MILAFSTSSPWASVALLSDSGELVWSQQEHAPRNAGTASLAMLDRNTVPLEDVTLFAADLGPGSFTGVRVGVMLAKTLAWVCGGQCVGEDAFNLISPDRLVAIPSKKDEFFLRSPGRAPERVSQVPSDAVGYGFGAEDRPPNAANFAQLAGTLEPMAPERLLPRYLIEASISTPKSPFSRLKA